MATEYEKDLPPPAAPPLPNQTPVNPSQHSASIEKECESGVRPTLSNRHESDVERFGSKEPPIERVEYPEGGTEAWLVVLGSFSALLAGFGMMNSLGIFQAYMTENQLKNYTPAQIGWITSTYAFLSFFCGVQIGPIFDRHGPKLLVLAGSILTCASMLLLGVCTKYYQFFIVFGLMGGTGTSLIFTPGYSAIGHWFFRKRGNATGIAAMGGSLGGVIFPLMLQRLIKELGFAWATRILGFIFIGLTSIGVALIRSRLPPKPGGSIIPDFRIFRAPGFALTTLGVFLLEFGLFQPLAYIPTFGLSTGAISPAFSYQIIAIFNAASCFGRWCPGYFADRFGRFNTALLGFLICGGSTFCIWLPATLLSSEHSTAITVLLIIYSILFGFASGSGISLTPACVGQQCETNQYGRYYATCYTIASFSTLTGIPISGALIKVCGGGYWGVAIFTGLSYVGAFAAFAGARACEVGWKLGRIY